MDRKLRKNYEGKKRENEKEKVEKDVEMKKEK